LVLRRRIATRVVTTVKRGKRLIRRRKAIPAARSDAICSTQ